MPPTTPCDGYRGSVPELPEVEVVRRGLEPYTGSWRVTAVDIRDSRALKRHPGTPRDFIDALTGATLHAAVRRGKFLWFPLLRDGEETGRALLCHLGMSGQMLLGDHSDQFGPLLRVGLSLESDGGANQMVGFVDQRLFGSLAIDRLVSTHDGHPGGLGSSLAVIPSQVAHIARDPLDPSFDDKAFSRRLRTKHTGIKRALLDQTLVSGVGNIYADETLWESSLHYDYPAHRLTAGAVSTLLANLRGVFTRALDQGGTSFDWQYVNVNGQSGYFSQSLNAYGQDGVACARCRRIIVREPFMNRSSFRCPGCQRRPVKRVG